MGLKYIEQVKSVILLLLILLSLTLTFTIWTYSPSYDTNETPIVDIAIAEKKKIEDVIKPYRLILSQENAINGTIKTVNIERVLNSMKSWDLQTVELHNNKISPKQINELINMPNRATFFYRAEVPIEIFGSILTFADHNYPDASFNRLVVDWADSSDDINLYFLNTVKQKVYTTSVEKVDKEGFTERIIQQASNMPVYNEIERPGRLSLYVSTIPEDTVKYTYYIAEIAPERFKNALFSNPSLVRSNPVGTSQQEYTDDTALMKVDFLYKRLNFVNPASESESAIDPADLILNSVNFVNEHNGWTDDYRYSKINATITQQIHYQLHFLGLPVFSNDTETEIIQNWGVNQVYRYTRPYYTLNALPIKPRDVQLPSGQATYDLLTSIPELNVLSSIDEMVPGYYLSRDDNQPLLTLEPSWYYLINGSWIRVSPDLLGGGKFGLE